MQSAIERREKIVELISDKRKTNIKELMSIFNVSRATVKRDILILTCSYPIYTQPGNDGGIYAMKGWTLGRRYLRPEQASLLRDLMSKLEPDQRIIMKGILTTFSMPEV